MRNILKYKISKYTMIILRNINRNIILPNIDKNVLINIVDINNICDNIKLKHIEKHIDKITDFKKLSRNPYLTPEFIEKHIDKPWSWIFLSYNKNLTCEFIEKYINKLNTTGISTNNNVKLELIEKYTGWNYIKLSKNKNLTNEFVEKHIDKPWDFNLLISRNLLTCNSLKEYNTFHKNSFKKGMFINHLNKTLNYEYIYVIKNNWKFEFLSYNKSLPLKFIEENINENWNWKLLSRNRNLTQEFVEKYKDKPWDFFRILHTKSITLDYFQNNISKINNKIIMNPNMSFKFVLKNLNRIPLITLIQNKNVPYLFIEKLIQNSNHTTIHSLTKFSTNCIKTPHNSVS